jgi:hypothetical protein
MLDGSNVGTPPLDPSTLFLTGQARILRLLRLLLTLQIFGLALYRYFPI